MPTLYGNLSFSARTVDDHTFRFDVGPGVSAAIELRPPLSGRLIGVSVNGSEYRDFDAESVVIASAPAAIVCHVAGSA
jgi:hypothetical protein